MSLTTTINWIDRALSRRSSSKTPVFYPQIPDDLTVYAVGDIHGRFDLLTAMLNLIDEDRRQYPSGRSKIIFLGDYVDRGPQTREVIERLRALQDSSHHSVTTLKGNHEQLLLQFLADPRAAYGWVDHGGAATLASYGVPLPRWRDSEALWVETRDLLDEALPPAHRNFLLGLPLFTTIGDYVFVHGGLKRGVPLEQQAEHDLLWSRPDTRLELLLDRKTLVHGHNAAKEPAISISRIGIDTGAYATGVLTAICLHGYEQRLLQTHASPSGQASR